MQKPDFLVIPYVLIEDTRITQLEQTVYGIIYWYTKLKCEKCIAGNPTLAIMSQTTPATLNKCLRHLEQYGYIQRKYTDENKKVRDEIVPLVAFTKVKPHGSTLNLRVQQVKPHGSDIYIYNNTNKSKEYIAKENIAKLIDFYEKHIGNVRYKNKLAKRLNVLGKDFTEKELATIIQNKYNDDWFMKNLAQKGPTWFFSNKTRLTKYLDEDR